LHELVVRTVLKLVHRPANQGQEGVPRDAAPSFASRRQLDTGKQFGTRGNSGNPCGPSATVLRERRRFVSVQELGNAELGGVRLG
jgi:hypothetical protein